MHIWCIRLFKYSTENFEQRDFARQLPQISIDKKLVFREEIIKSHIPTRTQPLQLMTIDIFFVHFLIWNCTIQFYANGTSTTVIQNEIRTIQRGDRQLIHTASKRFF